MKTTYSTLLCFATALAIAGPVQPAVAMGAFATVVKAIGTVKGDGIGTTENESQDNCYQSMEKDFDAQGFQCPLGTGPVIGTITYISQNPSSGIWTTFCSADVSCEPYY